MLWDETGEYLQIRASEGIPDHVIKEVRVKRGENISGWVAQEGQPLLIRDLSSDPRFVGIAQERYRTNSLLSVPLKAKGQVLGVININNQSDNRIFTDEDQNLMMLFANQAAIALENARLYRELERLAITDGLTGLSNHRAFQERLAREISRAQRFMQEVSLLIIDIDFFKTINDKHGHLIGDHVLRCVSKLLLKTLRRMDFVSRYGGEEFAIIMPQTRKEEAVRIADRLRQRFEDARWIEQEPDRMVTVSIGVAEFPTDAGESQDLVEKADQALYQSKHTGRNRVTPSGSY
jgi:diguanylate cyclase (GGDEF)-like protein